MKKGPFVSNAILAILLIISVIFKDKLVYLAPNLSVSISIFIYAITFLVPVFIATKYKYREAKKSLKNSALILILFYILTTILCTVSGNLESEIIDNALRMVFASNSIAIKSFILYYPDLNILGIGIIYLFTHNVLLSVFEALKSYTNAKLSYTISVFISFIIDTMFMVPIINIVDIYYANINMIGLIKLLTASFMVVIFTSLLMSATYALVYSKKKD